MFATPLTVFMPMTFLYPIKASENTFFLEFSGGIEIGHWREKD